MYSMNTTPKGHMLIFNNKTFPGKQAVHLILKPLLTFVVIYLVVSIVLQIGLESECVTYHNIQ